MSNRLLFIFSITLIFFAISTLGQKNCGDEDVETYAAIQQRFKRMAKGTPLRWGKRSADQLRWGKRQAPLSMEDTKNRFNDYLERRWGKRQTPLRWGKRSNFENGDGTNFLKLEGKRRAPWSPHWTPRGDNNPQEIDSDLKDETETIDLDLNNENESSYQFGTKFPIRNLDKVIKTAHLKALMEEVLSTYVNA